MHGSQAEAQCHLVGVARTFYRTYVRLLQVGWSPPCDAKLQPGVGKNADAARTSACATMAGMDVSLD